MSAHGRARLPDINPAALWVAPASVAVGSVAPPLDARARATIRALFRQTVRWATAAKQDREPLVAVLHANYGVAYALALRQVASDAEIRAVTGHDGKALEDRVVAVQDAATARLAGRCPRGAPRTVLDGEVVVR